MGIAGTDVINCCNIILGSCGDVTVDDADANKLDILNILYIYVYIYILLNI